MKKNIAINKKILLNDARGLFELFSEEKKNFNDVNLSTLINRLSKIIPPKYFFSCRKNISEIVYLIPRYDFEPNNISSLLNVFSKWPISIQEAPYSETIKYLLQKISYHAQNFNAQDISVTLNALSKWPQLIKEAYYSEAIDMLVQCIPQKARDFNAQSISVALNAMSKWPECIHNVACTKTIDVLVQCIPQKARDFNAQQISNTLNALSKWSVCIEKLAYAKVIDVLVQCIPQKVHEFNAQSISVTFNALSKWPECINNVACLETIDVLVQCVPQKAHEFNAQEISVILNALSKWLACIEKPAYVKVIDVLVQCIPQKAHEFNAQDISVTLNALSKWSGWCLRECPTYLKSVDVLINCISEKMDTFTIQQISVLTLAWCFFQFLNDSNFQWINNEEMIKKLIKNNETSIIEELNIISAKQFYQIYLYQPDLIPYSLSETIKNRQFKSEEITTSRLQNEVFQYLLACFPEFKFVEEHFLEFTYVDIACPEKKILMQVNGPSHYVGKKLNVSSQFNNHLFEKLGWSVVIIPYFDWQALIKESARKKYLKRKLGPLIKQLSEKNAINTVSLYKNNERSDINMPSIDDEREGVKLLKRNRPKKSVTLSDEDHYQSPHQRFGKI